MGLQSRQHLQLGVLEVQVKGPKRSGVGAHGEAGNWKGQRAPGTRLKAAGWVSSWRKVLEDCQRA